MPFSHFRAKKNKKKKERNVLVNWWGGIILLAGELSSPLCMVDSTTADYRGKLDSTSFSLLKACVSL